MKPGLGVDGGGLVEVLTDPIQACLLADLFRSDARPFEISFGGLDPCRVTDPAHMPSSGVEPNSGLLRSKRSKFRLSELTSRSASQAVSESEYALRSTLSSGRHALRLTRFGRVRLREKAQRSVARRIVRESDSDITANES